MVPGTCFGERSEPETGSLDHSLLPGVGEEDDAVPARIQLASDGEGGRYVAACVNGDEEDGTA